MNRCFNRYCQSHKVVFFPQTRYHFVSKVYFEVYENKLTVITGILMSPLSVLALPPLAVKFTEFAYECYFK